MLFKKTISPNFDQIDIEGDLDSDWLHLTMRVGNNVETVHMTLRSTEAVRDLHYALTRYLDTLDGKTKC